MEAMSTESQSSVGEILKQGRLRQRLSVAECAKRTHIAPRFIEALEDEKWAILPSESHRLGFLRLYSRFLGVSAEEVLTLYRKKSSTTGDSSPVHGKNTTPAAHPPEPNRYLDQAPRIRTASRSSWSPSSIPQLIGFLITMLLLAWVLYHWVSPQFFEPSQMPWAHRRSSTEARLSTPTKPLIQTHKIYVKATLDCWMRVTAANVLLYEGILRAGSSKEWSGAEPFFLKIGNVHALSLTWNDQPVDLLSSATAGTSSIRIPPQ